MYSEVANECQQSHKARPHNEVTVVGDLCSSQFFQYTWQVLSEVGAAINLFLMPRYLAIETT